MSTYLFSFLAPNLKLSSSSSCHLQRLQRLVYPGISQGSNVEGKGLGQVPRDGSSTVSLHPREGETPVDFM